MRYFLAAAVTLSLVTGAARAQDSTRIRDSVRADSGVRFDSIVSIMPAEPPRTHVRMSFTGDINLGTLTIRSALPPDSGRTFFSRVDTLLKGDLVIGNFEGVLADTGASEKCGKALRIDSIAALPPLPEPAVKPKPKPVKRTLHHKPKPRMCYAFATPTWMAPRLVEAGFTHLNLANNHSGDMGQPARLASDSVLRSLGLKTYGPLGSIVIDTIWHGDSATVVGVIGFTTYPFAYNLLDSIQTKSVIDSIRPLVHVLVVTFHGGAEGETAQHVPVGPEKLGKEERGDLRTWTHLAIDEGADMVVGHGPHVLRAIEFYRGRPIAYSLGNFATFKGFNLQGPGGLSTILQAELTGGGALVALRAVPLVQVAREGPRPDSLRRSSKVIRRLSKLDFGDDGAVLDSTGVVTIP